MSRCKPVAIDRPAVWKDDFGWNCDQSIRCLTCGDCWSDRLAEDTTWLSAIAASAGAREITTEETGRGCSREQCPNCTDGYIECAYGTCEVCDDLYAAKEYK